MSHCKENKETEEKPFLIEQSNATKMKNLAHIFVIKALRKKKLGDTDF